MVSLEFREMEETMGGLKIGCGTGWGLVVGLTVGFTALAVVTGGAVLPIVIAAEAAFVGSPIAGLNCIA